MSDRNKLMRLAASLATAEDAERALEALSLGDVLVRQAREDLDTVKQAVIEWMIATGSEIETIDGKRYYVGVNKRTKIRDLGVTVEAILHAVGGDIEAFVEALSSNAIKPGHAKKVLGDAWGDHFEVTEIDDLKTGKPKKVLKLADDRYITK